MVDPIEYLLQTIINPKLDSTSVMVSIVGVVLFILWTITIFFKNKMIQSILFDLHESLMRFMEKKKTNLL
jgi:hypothetical protein